MARLALPLSSILVLALPAAAQDIRPTQETVERAHSGYSPYPDQDLHDMVKAGKGYDAFIEWLNYGSERPFDNPEMSRAAWDDILLAAETHNAPGAFTAFIGFAWTSHPSGNKLHRVVVFRDGSDRAKQVIPFSAYDPEDPEEVVRLRLTVPERRSEDGRGPTVGRNMTATRTETDSLGEVEVQADKLWGAQTQRALEHFSIGKDLMPREMITAYAVLKKAAANANHAGGRLDDEPHRLILQACEEILAGQHHDMFPLHVWMTGSGTQFHMNVNEVISNRCCQLAGTALGSKAPVHPNDHVNMSQSSNDSFPSAMYVAAAVNVWERLLPAVAALRDAIATKAEEWKDIVKIGRTHLQDATPITLGQEWSGYQGMLDDDIERIGDALKGTYRLALGGTAVGTGLNAAADFADAAAAEIARLTGLPFVSAPNKFTVQGAHAALVHLSGALRTLATSLYKIADDIRLLSCGPRAGFAELAIPENEPGSSIMPGKVNPTQAEALTMVAVQVMANDVAVGFGGAGGHLEMNVYKPLMIFNLTHSITLLTDGCTSFRKFLVEGTEPNLKKIGEYVERSLMLVTALAPVIGYDKASKIAHYAADNDLTLKAAALKLGFVTEEEFDRIVDPAKMVKPYVATGA